MSLTLSTPVAAETPPAIVERAGARPHTITWVFLLALAIRLGFTLGLWPVVQAKFDLSSGSDGYEHVARTLVAGGGFKFAPHLGETMILPPTYPAFLAGLFALVGDGRETQILATRIVQSVLDAATCALLCLLAGRWFGTRVGLCAGLLYALYPGAWIACSRYLTEPLFAFLLVAAVLALANWVERRNPVALAAAALALAALALCKSVAPLLPLALLGALCVVPWFWRGVWKRTVAGLLICTIVSGAAAAGWVARNYAVSGTPVFPSTLGGQALYTAQVYATHPDQSIRASVDQAAFEMSAIAVQHGIRLDPKDAYPRWFYNSADEVRLDHILRGIAAERIAADGAAFRRHVLGNLWRFWFGAPSPRAILFSVATNLPILILAILGLFMSRFWRNPALALWLAAGAYLFLSHVTVLAVVRYSLTVMPLLCVLAAIPLGRWLLRARAAEAQA